MRIYRDWEPAGAPLAVALGSFDGLHRGHQAVIGQVLNCPGTGTGAWSRLTKTRPPCWAGSRCRF